MADTSYPSPAHNDRQVNDLEYERLSARFSDDGVYGEPLNPPVVTAGTGLTVTVRPDVAASVRGHAWYSGTTPLTLPITPSSSGQARIDWVVLRLDRSDWTVRAAVITGTPGGGPPALTQQTDDTGVYEIPLAQVRVLALATTVTVTRAELYAGTRCRPCTSTTRNPHPRLGETCFEGDTRRHMMWDGYGWRTLWEDSGETILQTVAAPGWTVDSGTVLRIRNGIVFLRLGAFGRTSALAGTVESRLPILLPEAARPPVHWQFGIVYITGLRIGRIVIYDRTHARAGQVWLGQHPDMTSNDSVVSTSLTWAV
ncbi:hypothetical protein [Streptomyces sp. CFMR 7]|uniref:hypothetical protein n=1 Tax=Streptomyces sp. CFMR 7 TaxID=1649184 RepID=UPI0011A2E188|nr:hypothetical protein [Streptomyces sp. CFMR 7]